MEHTMENTIYKWMIWEYPYFSKPPYGKSGLSVPALSGGYRQCLCCQIYQIWRLEYPSNPPNCSMEMDKGKSALEMDIRIEGTGVANELLVT
jgi:hypothetical protein